MDSFLAAKNGDAARRNPVMVFNWDEAARRIVASGAKAAEVGLLGDWEWTGGVILEDGEPVHDSYTYLASTWATPMLVLDGGKPQPCFLLQKDCEWDSGTKWPSTSLAILRTKGTP